MSWSHYVTCSAWSIAEVEVYRQYDQDIITMVQSLQNPYLRHGVLWRQKFAGIDVSHNVATT